MRDDYVKHKPAELSVDSVVTVRFEPNSGITVRGAYDPNNSTGAGGVLYSGAAGAGGLLAQVLVHAAVADNAQEAKLEKQQEQADQVLQPFQSQITHLTTADLLHSDSRYIFGEKADPGGLILQSKPIFYLSPDKRQVSVVHVVEVQDPAATKNKITKYTNIVEVLGPVLATDTAETDLLSNTSLSLNQQIRWLYHQSLDLAMRDIHGTWAANATEQASHRIRSGDVTRIERGTILQSDCSSQVIRNLRGWIIAFPLDTDAEVCDLNSSATTGQEYDVNPTTETLSLSP